MLEIFLLIPEFFVVLQWYLCHTCAGVIKNYFLFNINTHWPRDQIHYISSACHLLSDIWDVTLNFKPCLNFETCLRNTMDFQGDSLIVNPKIHQETSSLKGRWDNWFIWTDLCNDNILWSIFSAQKTFFIYDLPHLIKAARNNLENSHGKLKTQNLIVTIIRCNK